MILVTDFLSKPESLALLSTANSAGDCRGDDMFLQETHTLDQGFWYEELASHKGLTVNKYASERLLGVQTIEADPLLSQGFIAICMSVFHHPT